MQELSSTLTAEQKKLSVKPVVSFVFSHNGNEYTYNTDRLQRAEHSQSHSSHKAELVLQNSDGEFTAKNLRGYAVSPSWGLNTSAGDEVKETAPLWVKDMWLHSLQGRMECHLTCIGIPDRLTEDKANDNYENHWSSVKTVKDLITEIADGQPVSEELTVKQEKYDTSVGELFIALDSGETNSGCGQRVHIPNRTITKVSFKIKRVGVPGDVVTFRILDAEIPLSAESVLAEKSIGAASTISLSATWYEATLDTPITVDGDVWMYCQSQGGYAGNLISVAYSSRDVKENELLVLEDSVKAIGADTEYPDLDCIYRYKFNYAGVSVFDHCEAYSVEYDPHGTHTGGTHATIMTDSVAAFKTDTLIGQVIYNVTDGSSGTITDNDTTTVTVSALSGGSDNQWENGDSYTIEDSLLDVYIPADSYYIAEGESRLNAIDKLLAYTSCERMFKADGKIHILVPTTTGEEYDYEYSLASGEHAFFSKSTKESLVIPNKVVVKSYARDAIQYEGSATSPTSYALMPISGVPLRTTLVSSAQGAAIAAARISHLEAMAQRGNAYVPMNVGAEIWDYVNVTDQRQDDTRAGNLGYLTRVYNPNANNYHMTFGFGDVPTKRIPGTKLEELKSSFSNLAALPPDTVVTWGSLSPKLWAIADSIEELQKAVFYSIDELDEKEEGLVAGLNNLTIRVRAVEITMGIDYID